MRAAAESAGFEHTALFYTSQDECLAGASAFTRSALARGEPVLAAVAGSRIGAVREALGADAQRVVFIDVAQTGRNPGRLISLVQAFRQGHPGSRVSVVGEPAWPGRSDPELREVAKHEALSNRAFGNQSISGLCLYDAARLPAGMLTLAEQTHPLIASRAGPRPSPSYLGPDRLPGPCLEPLPDPVPVTRALPYRTDLHPVRAIVLSHALPAGLARDRAEDLALAAGELAANTLRHPPGGGALRIWRTAEAVVCEITDHGLFLDPLAGRLHPLGQDPASQGLWLVNQICDLVETRSGPAGATVRLHMRLPGA